MSSHSDVESELAALKAGAGAARRPSSRRGTPPPPQVEAARSARTQKEEGRP